MPREVLSPPPADLLPDGTRLGGWWHTAETGERIVCDLCPRACVLKPGDRGFCFVRENRDGEMVLATYGRSTGFCIDPIEKKPLNHFYPGTSVLSFGTAGCNLGCKFCQNWDISKSREVARASERATPEMIAEAANRLGCRSVAYTYNDPVIWAEYAIDVARACRERGVRSVAVTAGYITPLAREAFFGEMDAANVDLKAFNEEFYYKLTYSHLQPVLDTLEWLQQETDVWFEVTNLIIPGENDGHDELRQMCQWILDRVGDQVPLHFSAFHPDFRMRDKPRTPPETLLAAREIALRAGVKYAYVGNVDDVANQSTYCPHCGGLLIERNWYDLYQYHLKGDACAHCGGKIAGRFDTSPGDWGRKRLPVKISDFAPPAPTAEARSATPSSTPSAKGTSAMKPGPTQPDDPTADVPHGPHLTTEQEDAIHRAACRVVAAGVCGQSLTPAEPEWGGAAEDRVMGAFVTLKRQGRLRACCGTLGQPMPLAHAVQYAAFRTATEDTRFPTISPTELPRLHLDVTLLYGFQPLTAHGRDRIGEIEVGRHGLRIQRGQSAGLLLPVVATENGWDAETFLQHVCRKAGLPATAWMDDAARLQKFAGHRIPRDFDTGVLAESAASKLPPLSATELQTLAEHCRVNIVAMLRGATPNYYLAGCPDGSFELVAVTASARPDGAAHTASQMSLRPGVPLQATLFSLCQNLAASLQRDPALSADLSELRVDLTVLFDPAMHGTVAQVDLEGFRSADRALLVIDQSKNAWRFDPGMDAHTLLDSVARDAQIRMPQTASVFSLGAISTAASASVSSVPRPATGAQVRPAAVAGTFYPADAAELDRVVSQCLGDPPPKTEAWPAVMVPHAGLVYSGRLAAQTLQRVTIPETVIIIGPKHTRFGVDWAVAPHDTWSLPGASLDSDPDLARQLAQAIPHLELDAAAHQREHAIEVELPILARLAPNTRVVGIAIGAADWASCQAFAEGLASVLKTCSTPPLLVISSDMNHFASDDENRRLDQLALQAMEQLDPPRLYETVVERYGISMCGVRPAVIVMETLRQLGQLNRCERVGYSTSADVSGDKSRVVGYAGMLLGA